VEPFERLWALACVAARDRGISLAADGLRGITYAEKTYRHFSQNGKGSGSIAIPGWAEEFFGRWYAWACRCRMPPIQKVAKMLKKRLGNLLTWFRHRISNGPSEGFNSRIQSIKSAARGFRNFANYRTRILFFCGKPNLLPEITH